MGGELCHARLHWLSEQLNKDTQKPTLIFMHHPPFKTGIKAMDKIICAGGDDLKKLIELHAQVIGVMCGHVHRHVNVKFGNTIGMIAPSTAAILGLQLTDQDPSIIIPWTKELPGFLLHQWNEKDGLISHCMGFAY